jgi:predicted nucleic acid-binding Zn ribbon protein
MSSFNGSIGSALNLLLERSQWKPKVFELRIQQEWEQIVGKTISKYTRDLKYNNKTLTIITDIAALKQELLFGREQLIVRINEYFKERVVEQITIR